MAEDGARRVSAHDDLDKVGAETLRALLRQERAARREAERVVAERGAALDRAFDGVALTDADGVFVYMNDSHARMFGWRGGAAALGRSWRDLYAPAEIAFIETTVFPQIGRTGGWRGEIAGRRGCGAVVHQEVTLSLLDAGLLCVTRDIGERRALEQERRRLSERLLSAQSLAALGRFAAALSHDFSAVIGAARHYAENCRRAAMDGAAAHDLDGLTTSLDRAQGLTRRLLQIGRPEQPEREDAEPADVAHVLRETFDLVFAGSDAQARLLGAEEPTEIVADKVRLEQLFANLLFNAEQACRGRRDASVQVRLTRVDTAEAVQALEDNLWTASAPGARREHAISAVGGSGLAIAVSDTGAGMDAAALGRLFEPFFSTQSGGGHGLGLLSIENSLEALGGRIVYRSEPGAGTLAIAVIPERPAAPQPTRGGYVMVVEDDQAAAAAIVERLAERAIPARHFADPGAALRAFATTADCAAIVSDCGLGGVDGAEVALAAARWRPETPIFLVSSSDALLGTSKLRARFAQGFFKKPLSADALQQISAAVRGDE